MLLRYFHLKPVELSAPAMALNFAITLASFSDFLSPRAEISMGSVLSCAGESLAFRGLSPPLAPEELIRVPL